MYHLGFASYLPSIIIIMFNIYRAQILHACAYDQMRSYKLRFFKLRLILRREENRRTRRKTLEARERPTTTTLLT